MVGIHGETKLSKYNCPTCNGNKSKLAHTCMMCFRSGLGVKSLRGRSPRFKSSEIDELVIKLKATHLFGIEGPVSRISTPYSARDIKLIKTLKQKVDEIKKKEGLNW